MKLDRRITERMDRVAEICDQYGVKKLYAFGSATRKDFQFYSDLDLLVDFRNEEDNSPLSEKYYWLREELCYNFRRPVDLLVYKSAVKSKIKDQIKKEKVLIYG